MSECSVDRGAADTQDVADLCHGEVLLVVEFLSCRHLVCGQVWWSAAGAASCSSGGQSGVGAFCDEVSFKFGQ